MYKYDAFLSYSSADEQFAKELQESLEKNFLKLSKKLKKNKNKIHIVRDRSDVEGGEAIDKVFEEKISQSKHLIVICSESVKENPIWVNKEILHFKNVRNREITEEATAGKKEKKRNIIIVNYNLKTPITKDSFPAALVGENYELPLAENSVEFTSSRKNYFGISKIDNFQLKIYAQLLNNPFSDFITRHKKNTRKQRLTTSLLIAFVIAIVSISVYFIKNSSSVIASTTQRKALDSMHTWITHIKEFKAAGIDDVQRCRDSAIRLYYEYPDDPAFITAKTELDSLTK